MKNTSFPAKIVAVLALCAMSAVAFSCGNNDSSAVYTAPYGSTIMINPQPKGTSVLNPGFCTYTSWKDEMFTITVLDAEGQPMNNISMIITLDWANNSASTDNRLIQLYDGDPNSGGVPVVVPFKTKTDSLGTKVVFVRNDLSCTYKGQLGVHAGTAYNFIDIEVKEGTAE